MPDLDLIKQGEQERVTRRGRLPKGSRADTAATPTVLATREEAGCRLLQIRCRCSKR